MPSSNIGTTVAARSREPVGYQTRTAEVWMLEYREMESLLQLYKCSPTSIGVMGKGREVEHEYPSTHQIRFLNLVHPVVSTHMYPERVKQ